MVGSSSPKSFSDHQLADVKRLRETFGRVALDPPQAQDRLERLGPEPAPLALRLIVAQKERDLAARLRGLEVVLDLRELGREVAVPEALDQDLGVGRAGQELGGRAAGFALALG